MLIRLLSKKLRVSFSSFFFFFFFIWFSSNSPFIDLPSLNEQENLEMFHQEVAVLRFSFNFILIFNLLIYFILFYFIFSALSLHPNIAMIVGYSESPKTIISPLYQTDLHKYIYNQTIEYDYSTVIQIIKQMTFGLQGLFQFLLSFFSFFFVTIFLKNSCSCIINCTPRYQTTQFSFGC